MRTVEETRMTFAGRRDGRLDVVSKSLRRSVFRSCSVSEGKQLACSRECKFIETSSGIQHNVDELLVGVLKQIRLRETRDKKKQNNQRKRSIHGSKTSLSLHIAKEILQKMCLLDSKSKSCGNLHVL